MLSYTMDPDIIKGLNSAADHNCHRKVCMVIEIFAISMPMH